MMPSRADRRKFSVVPFRSLMMILKHYHSPLLPRFAEHPRAWFVIQSNRPFAFLFSAACSKGSLQSYLTTPSSIFLWYNGLNKIREAGHDGFHDCRFDCHLPRLDSVRENEKGQAGLTPLKETGFLGTAIEVASISRPILSRGDASWAFF